MKSFKKFLISAYLFIFPMLCLAANGGTNPGSGSSGSSGGLKNPLQDINSISGLLSAILDIVSQIMAPIIVLAIIYTGFLFVKAQGKDEELTKAKQALLWTVIGAIVVLGATVLSSAIEGTINELTAFVGIMIT